MWRIGEGMFKETKITCISDQINRTNLIKKSNTIHDLVRPRRPQTKKWYYLGKIITTILRRKILKLRSFDIAKLRIEGNLMITSTRSCSRYPLQFRIIVKSTFLAHKSFNFFINYLAKFKWTCSKTYSCLLVCVQHTSLQTTAVLKSIRRRRLAKRSAFVKERARKAVTLLLNS